MEGGPENKPELNDTKQGFYKDTLTYKTDMKLSFVIESLNENSFTKYC